jgi:hypothetical protein
VALNPNTKTAIAVVAGTVLSAAYFRESERGIPKESNCTYLAPWTTDVAAWAAGAALIFLGAKNESPTTSFLGAAIATLHVAQFAAHKVNTRPPERVLVDALTADHSDDEAIYNKVFRGSLAASKLAG